MMRFLFQATATVAILFATVFMSLSFTDFAGDAAAAEHAASSSAPPGDARVRFILGVAWQPAFCETHGKLPECAGQTAQSVDATQFSLSGLWQTRKSFCGVTPEVKAQDRKRDWTGLPAVSLGPDLAGRLAVAMPGVVSGLDRHVWLRNGTCQPLGTDAYFSLQLRLLDALNGSAVRALFRDNIGGEVTEAEVKAAFDRSFSPGAGERARMHCRKVGDRMLVTGLTIGVTFDPLADMAAADPAALILAAAPTVFACDKGIVDAAGGAVQQHAATVVAR